MPRRLFPPPDTEPVVSVPGRDKADASTAIWIAFWYTDLSWPVEITLKLCRTKESQTANVNAGKVH